jgi:hypothetical protein
VSDPRAALSGAWQRLAERIAWTRPTSTEIGVVVKSGLAAGLSWMLAALVTDNAAPVLASLTSMVVVQVSVRASVRRAIERTIAVVLGVLVALAIGDAFALNAITVTLLVVTALGVAELVLRLPTAAARQVPISVLVILAAVTGSDETEGWERVVATLVGAVVGVSVSLVLPASRVLDAQQTLTRLADSLGESLDAMGEGLHDTWSTIQTEEWRRNARVTRERLVGQAAEAVGNSREAARWNVRDRRHIRELLRYEELLPRLERTAIGVSVIARGLDDHARLGGTDHRQMPAMGAMFQALAEATRTTVRRVLSDADDDELASALAALRDRRARCMEAAARRAQSAIDHGDDAQLEGEWLGYAALLVQVDRIAADLTAPLPT